jgi:hypothetical protein
MDIFDAVTAEPIITSLPDQSRADAFLPVLPADLSQALANARRADPPPTHGAAIELLHPERDNTKPPQTLTEALAKISSGRAANPIATTLRRKPAPTVGLPRSAATVAATGVPVANKPSPAKKVGSGPMPAALKAKAGAPHMGVSEGPDEVGESASRRLAPTGRRSPAAAHGNAITAAPPTARKAAIPAKPAPAAAPTTIMTIAAAKRKPTAAAAAGPGPAPRTPSLGDPKDRRGREAAPRSGSLATPSLRSASLHSPEARKAITIREPGKRAAPKAPAPNKKAPAPPAKKGKRKAASTTESEEADEDEEEGSEEGSYDEEEGSEEGSYDEEEGSEEGSYDEEEGSEEGSYDEEEGSYDEEEGSYDEEEGSYDEEEGSEEGSYEDESSSTPSRGKRASSSKRGASRPTSKESAGRPNSKGSGAARGRPSSGGAAARPSSKGGAARPSSSRGRPAKEPSALSKRATLASRRAFADMDESERSESGSSASDGTGTATESSGSSRSFKRRAPTHPHASASARPAQSASAKRRRAMEESEVLALAIREQERALRGLKRDLKVLRQVEAAWSIDEAEARRQGIGAQDLALINAFDDEDVAKVREVIDKVAAILDTLESEFGTQLRSYQQSVSAMDSILRTRAKVINRLDKATGIFSRYPDLSQFVAAKQARLGEAMETTQRALLDGFATSLAKVQLTQGQIRDVISGAVAGTGARGR